MKFLIVNTTRGTVLGDQVSVAATSSQRRTGLLKHSSLPQGGGLWIKPCESIHTIFMRFPIDVIYVDRKARVRKIRHSLRPWRLSFCLLAKSVLELPAGTALTTQTQVGDQLEFRSSQAVKD
jgi:uncharacterized protein